MTVEIVNGDCRAVLAAMEAETVHAIAADIEGFDALLIEKEADYAEIGSPDSRV